MAGTNGSRLNDAADPPQADDTLACFWRTHWSDRDYRNSRGQRIEIVNPKQKGWNEHNAGIRAREISWLGLEAPATSTRHEEPGIHPIHVNPSNHISRCYWWRIMPTGLGELTLPSHPVGLGPGDSRAVAITRDGCR